MGPEDLARERLSADVFRALHKKVICRDNIVMGITGDIGQQDLDHAGALDQEDSPLRDVTA